MCFRRRCAALLSHGVFTAIERIIADLKGSRSYNVARSFRSALLAGDCPGLTTDADLGSPVAPIRLVSEGAADEFQIIRDIAEYARSKANIAWSR